MRFDNKYLILNTKLAYIFVLSFLFLFFSFQKTNTDTIDINHFDEVKLEKMVLEKVNVLRKRYKAKPLVLDSILAVSAKDHAEYLLKKKKLTHFQNNKKKKQPIDRTDFYGGKYNYVGENIAFTYIKRSVDDIQNNTKGVVITTYSQLADYFYWLWKKSPSHYKVMKDKKFEETGIRFSYDKKLKRVYAVQVFGTL